MIGFTGDGITINNHKGNIVLHHVTSNNDTDGGSGLIIDHQLSGTVTIDQGSQFNDNDSMASRLYLSGMSRSTT